MTSDTVSDLPIILLAAGQSRRMRGADKLLEEVDGLPLLRRQAELASAVTTGPVLVALPPAPHPRYRSLDALAVDRVPVADADEGMNASLRTAFAALPRGAPAAMLLLADLPELTKEDLRVVLQAIDLKPEALIWRGATEDGKPGHPIVFAAPLFEAFASLQGDGGGREVVAKAGSRVALIPLPGQHARRDLDTPEDWAAWRAERAARNSR
ncbi:nucleotidyltransferase family protein [Roseobacter sinensis]|uniref:Nucleotidyltransferase family protein n=1 Tax=Roseobacter sinensis TaxID=2931391 RepID=A0ABT3BBR0_9RHOB|nr:nucleotidyltransferase family protein [Roseobacter sp. WL0113]MCV3271008.1 nucleotidyltransferase family protein [Roseobacter sp. WL0113]